MATPTNNGLILLEAMELIDRRIKTMDVASSSINTAGSVDAIALTTHTGAVVSLKKNVNDMRMQLASTPWEVVPNSLNSKVCGRRNLALTSSDGLIIMIIKLKLSYISSNLIAQAN